MSVYSIGDRSKEDGGRDNWGEELRGEGYRQGTTKSQLQSLALGVITSSVTLVGYFLNVPLIGWHVDEPYTKDIEVSTRVIFGCGLLICSAVNQSRGDLKADCPIG